MNFLASREQLRASLIRWSLVCVPGCVLLGFLVSRIAGGGPGDPWFDALIKPAIYPPPPVFCIAWPVLYAAMGFALALVGSAWGARGRGPAIVVFAAQFLLNLAWSPVFFGAHQLTGGLIVIVVLDVLAALTIVMFWRVRKVAGALLLPYLAWIVFATALNFELLRLNPGSDGAEGGSGAAARVRIGD